MIANEAVHSPSTHLLFVPDKKFQECRDLANVVARRRKKNNISGATVASGRPFLRPEHIWILLGDTNNNTEESLWYLNWYIDSFDILLIALFLGELYYHIFVTSKTRDQLSKLEICENSVIFFRYLVTMFVR